MFVVIDFLMTYNQGTWISCFTVCTPETVAIGMARIGQSSQQIVVAPLSELLTIDLGAPLHSLVIPGKTHFLEDDMLKFYREQYARAHPTPTASDASAAAVGVTTSAAAASAAAAVEK